MFTVPEFYRKIELKIFDVLLNYQTYITLNYSGCDLIFIGGLCYLIQFEDFNEHRFALKPTVSSPKNSLILIDRG